MLRNYKSISIKIAVVIFAFFSTNVFASIFTETEKTTEDIRPKESLNYYEQALQYYKKTEYISAEESFLKATEIAEKTQDKECLAFAFHYLGNIESWKSNFIQSIQYHKKARNLFHELSNSEYEAISNNQISFVFESLGEFDSTLVYYQNNITNKEKIKAQYTVLNSYQKIAATYARLYNYKQAYRYLQEGIEYAEGIGNEQSLGEIYLTAGQLFLNNHVNKNIALEYLLEAQQIFEGQKNNLYINLTKLQIGDVYFKKGDDSLAMDFYREIIANTKQNNYAMHSATNHKIAMVFKKRGEYENALKYFKKSIDGMCTVCPEIQIHHTLIEAAQTYLILGNYEQAFLYLNRAKKVAINSNSGLEMAISFEELGAYHKSLNNTDSSIYYLELAHKLETELGLLQKIKKTAELLSEIYYSKKSFETASDYLKIANQMNDSLASIEKYNEVAKLEMRFEIEKKEAEITKQKLIRNFLIAGAISLVIIGLLLWRAFRNKKRANQLLKKQKEEIQEISKQLQQSSKRKLDFFTNVSHEIRTPLTLIKSPLERILNTENNNQRIGSQLQMALNNTNKLKDLVNQILDLQKLDENLLGLDLSSFELIAFCKEIVASFEAYCYQSKCRLNFKSNVNEVIVSFDKIRLQAIINNLLSNAFKFNKEGGFVKFNLEVNTSIIKLEIEDSGIGISNEHLKKLGERYCQVEQPNASVEGTGIGLAYVKELVELMKGNIEISSIENRGTSVTISFPCDTIAIRAEKPVSMEIKPKEQVFSQIEEQLSDNIENGLPRILIIEDNFDLRSFLRDLFSESYHVFCTKDGQEGKDMALKHLPDLILSDVMMPGIKGNELCKILKNDLNTSHITLILFTAKGSPDSIVDGYDCGADDYIVKPFDTDILVKKVKNILTTAENARKQFSFTDLERKTTVYSELDKKFLKDCMSAIQDNLDNSDFTVELLAEKMNIHRRTLLRKFKSLTGKSPVDLIKHSRMSRAAELIKQNYRVNEVALMVGYEDTNRFSKAFKQFHGSPPSTYNKDLS